MPSSLLVVGAASFLTGMLGYIIVRLWIRPIVRYLAAKRRLDAELARYLARTQVTVEPAGPGKAKRPVVILQLARRHAMELVTCYTTQIPYWYRLLLDSRRESPAEAAGLLTNLSRINDPARVRDRIERVRKTMGFR